MKTTKALDRKLQERLLTARRVEGDRLMLADAVLLAALEGRRPLTAGECAALECSPLTARRLRQLALERRAALHAGDATRWSRSPGMLRAADGGAISAMVTDDRHWTLHLVGGEGAWRVILQLAADAPFAPRLLRERPLLRVLDGARQAVLQGELDADGECEAGWPFANAPARHFQLAGAVFTVERLQP